MIGAKCTRTAHQPDANHRKVLNRERHRARFIPHLKDWAEHLVIEHPHVHVRQRAPETRQRDDEKDRAGQHRQKNSRDAKPKKGIARENL